MKQTLHLEGSPADVAAGAGRVMHAIQAPTSRVTVRIANRLFGEKTTPFEAPFLEATRTSFDAPLEPTDFLHDAEGARRSINGWVSAHTDDHIIELIPGGALSPSTRLVLANAIYFRGDWATQFEAARTAPAAFTTASGKTTMMPMMHAEYTARHVTEEAYSAVALPYVGGAVSMVFVLPTAVDGLPKVEAAFDAAALDALVSRLSAKPVALTIPKLDLSPPSLALASTLAALGMPSAFQAGADFSGMATRGGVNLSEVFHEAVLQLDEKGTVAVAATAVQSDLVTAVPAAPPPVPFVADHPFLFFLRDDATGLILFAGRVDDPTAR